MVAAPCSQWIACSPVRNRDRGWPLNKIVRRRMSHWPPPPEVGTPFNHRDEAEVETHYSADNFIRVVISRDKFDRLRIHPQAWCAYDHEIHELRHAHWLPLGGMATMTDTIENARKLALEAIAHFHDNEARDV